MANVVNDLYFVVIGFWIGVFSLAWVMYMERGYTERHKPKP